MHAGSCLPCNWASKLFVIYNRMYGWFVGNVRWVWAVWRDVECTR